MFNQGLPASASVLDPASAKVLRTVRLSVQSGFTSSGAGRIWVPDLEGTSQTVLGLDPTTGKVTMTLHVGANPSRVAFGFGSGWVSCKGSVYRFNPASGKVTAVIKAPTAGFVSVLLSRRLNRSSCHPVLMLFLLAASLLAVVAWIYLLAGHGGYWRTDQRLPPHPCQADPPGTGAWPAVVAVVPSRDEAQMLPQTLPTLLAQDYPGELTVVLVDDESADGTAQVAAKLAGHARRGDLPARLVIVPGEPTPPGWAGKVWAMEQGTRAAPDAELVLFTDADIGYAPGTLRCLVSAAQAGDLALVSQMALLRAESLAERLLIPAFVYFFAQLYPFRLVNRRAGRPAAAAGGCMLVRRQVLGAAGGLARIKGARIDDVALAGLLKRVRGACWLGFSTQVISRRAYDQLAAVWDMVSRSAYTQLRYSPALLAGTVAGLAWLYLVPVAAAASGLTLLAGGGAPAWQATWLAGTGILAWAIMSATYLPMLRLYRLSAGRAPLLPLIATFYTAMTISSAWRHHAGRGGEWKGRLVRRTPPGR